jgi:hypothetical protein
MISERWLYLKLRWWALPTLQLSTTFKRGRVRYAYCFLRRCYAKYGGTGLIQAVQAAITRPTFLHFQKDKLLTLDRVYLLKLHHRGNGGVYPSTIAKLRRRESS